MLDGEPYLPTVVGSVLGQPDVLLHGPGGATIAAPTASDLAGKGDGWYLDPPGNPLSPGCDYDSWFRRVPGSNDATVYGRVTTDPDHRDRRAAVLVLLWFQRLERQARGRLGDGPAARRRAVGRAGADDDADEPRVRAARGLRDGVVDRPEGAQGRRPRRGLPGAGVARGVLHAGAVVREERRRGVRLRQHPGAGTVLHPAVVVLPGTASGEFAWLSYTGRWGERRSFNNGPTRTQHQDAVDAPRHVAGRAGSARGCRAAADRRPGRDRVLPASRPRGSLPVRAVPGLAGDGGGRAARPGGADRDRGRRRLRHQRRDPDSTAPARPGRSRSRRSTCCASGRGRSGSRAARRRGGRARPAARPWLLRSRPGRTSAT